MAGAGAAEAEPGSDIQSKINQLKEVIRKTPAELLQERVYFCVANTCILLTAYKRDNGEKGWSSKVHNTNGEPLLNSEEQRATEEGFAKAPWLLEMLNEELNKARGEEEQKQSILQVGGSGSWMPSLKTMGSHFIKKVDPPSLTDEDIGMDAMLEGFIKKIDSVDNFWDQIAYQSPGFLKALNDHQDFNVMGNRIPIKPIVNILMIVLDSILLSASLTPLKNHKFTKILNFIVFIEELLTGQWRQMILTSIGFFSPSGLAFGVIAKYIVNAWMFVSPELRTQLFKDVLKGGKSALLGFLLWASVTFPSDAVRASTEQSLAKIRMTVESLDDKLQELQEEGSAALAPYGKKIEFKGIDLNNLRKISFQDIQNLQSLAQWDILVCSKEFQGIMQGLEGNTIFRFIIELLNIPTMDDDKYQMCRTLDFRPIKETVEQALAPQVMDSVPKPPEDPFADYNGEGSNSDSDSEFKKEESKVKEEESKMGAEESKPFNEDKESDPVQEEDKEQYVHQEEKEQPVHQEEKEENENPIDEEKLRQEEVHQEKLHQEEVHQEKLHQEEVHQEKLHQEKLHQEEVHQEKLHQEKLHQEKLHQEKLHQEEEQKRKHHENENENENPQKGGKRVLKLKKSTRYRKATPRRTTRRV